MTHDELLAKIDAKKEPWYNEITEDFELADMQLINALRAVVELHKPQQIDNALWCSECSKRFENSGYYEVYPCSTIQAIEKELK